MTGRFCFVLRHMNVERRMSKLALLGNPGLDDVLHDRLEAARQALRLVLATVLTRQQAGGDGI